MKGIVQRPFIKALLIIALVSTVFPMSILALLTPPVELHLNTVVDPISEFTFSEASPVTIIPGTPKTIGFQIRGNFLINLEIMSQNYGDSTFRMKHSDLDEYIPYTLYFDYGNGMQTEVTQGSIQPLSGYEDYDAEAGTGGYNIDSSLEITSNTAEFAPDGSYADTITFKIIAQ